MLQTSDLKVPWQGPGLVAQLVRVSSQHAKLVASSPGQGTYKKQPMMHKQVEQQIHVSLSFLPRPTSLPLSLFLFL